MIFDRLNKFFGNFQNQAYDADSRDFINDILRKLKNDNILKCPETSISFHYTSIVEIAKTVNY